MKKEAEKYFVTYIEEVLKAEELNGLELSSMHFSKSKQSNKKPCYYINFELNDLSFSGYFYQNKDEKWGFNHDPIEYFLEKDNVKKIILQKKELDEKYSQQNEQERIKQAKIAEKREQRALKNNVL